MRTAEQLNVLFINLIHLESFVEVDDDARGVAAEEDDDNGHQDA
jgi:hypothetical protein